jgi:hypothetical protein
MRTPSSATASGLQDDATVGGAHGDETSAGAQDDIDGGEPPKTVGGWRKDESVLKIGDELDGSLEKKKLGSRGRPTFAVTHDLVRNAEADGYAVQCGDSKVPKRGKQQPYVELRCSCSSAAHGWERTSLSTLSSTGEVSRQQRNRAAHACQGSRGWAFARQGRLTASDGRRDARRGDQVLTTLGISMNSDHTAVTTALSKLPTPLPQTITELAIKFGSIFNSVVPPRGRETAAQRNGFLFEANGRVELRKHHRVLEVIESGVLIVDDDPRLAASNDGRVVLADDAVRAHTFSTFCFFVRM